MTTKQAQAEAVRRWGRAGIVQKYSNTFKLPYAVGFLFCGMIFTPKGQGASWEDAFKNADEKGNGNV